MIETLSRLGTLSLHNASIIVLAFSIIVAATAAFKVFSLRTRVSSKALPGDSTKVSVVRNGSLEDDTRDTNYTATPQDLELIRQAEEAAAVEQYLVAGRLLRKVSNKAVLKFKHKRYLEMASQSERVMEDLMSPHPEEVGWTFQYESHGKRGTLIYYKVDDDFCLTCRIETPIEVSMLVPLLAVLNETDLFHAAGEAVMVKEFGRGNQIVHVTFDTPFPFDNREMYQYGFAVDEIDNSASIIARIYSLDPGEHDGVIIPEPNRFGPVRVDFDAGILVRSCPPNHPALASSRGEYPPGEKILLLSLTQSIDSHVHFVPKRLVNYVTRSMMGRVWGNLLATTEEVRDGSRPAHQEAIKNNQELYGWVEERVQVMLAKLDRKVEEEEETINKSDEAKKKSRKRFRSLFARHRKSKKKKTATAEQVAMKKKKKIRRRLKP